MEIIKKNKDKQLYDITKLSKSLDTTFKDLSVKKDDFLSELESIILTKKELDSPDIYDIMINTAIKKCVFTGENYNDLDWRFVAARLVMKKLYKNISHDRKVSKLHPYSFDEWYKQLLFLVDKKVYDKRFLEFSESELKDCYNLIKPEYDFQYDYAGANLITTRYLAKDNDKAIELPQELYLLSAILLSSTEEYKDWNDELKQIEEFYDSTASLHISLATPILLNLRKEEGNLASCFILAFSDSFNDISRGLDNIGNISRNAGGVGVNISRIRCKGSWIKGQIGASNGILNWIRLINDMGVSCNQAGARAGAVTVALDMWHYDIEDFLNLQTENGDLRQKAYDIFPQVVIPDLFMKRVQTNDKWTLFDPYEIRTKYNVELCELYGQDFELFYDKIEKDTKLKFRKEIVARELWVKYLKTAVETGMPYALFKDTVNNVNANKHVGMIGNANLCVRGNTKILTKTGYFKIGEHENEFHQVWNGFCYSRVKFVKTGENQRLFRVKLKDGRFLDCTEYHKWYNILGEEFRTHQLYKGMILEEYWNPDKGQLFANSVIEDVSPIYGYHDTYCFNEPLKHKGVFNDIYCGNCVESYSNFKPTLIKDTYFQSEKFKLDGSVQERIVSQVNLGETHVCSLVSLNMALILSQMQIDKYSRISVKILNAVIDLTTSPTHESEAHNNLYRIIGIGVMGLQDHFVKHKIPYNKAKSYVNGVMEQIQFSSLSESMELAIVNKPYKMFEGSEYSKGIICGKDAQWFINNETVMGKDKWLKLISDIMDYGLRNGGLLAVAPNTSSSLVCGVTSSFLPCYSKFFIDKNSKGSTPIAPKYLDRDTFWYYQENKNMNQNVIVDIASSMQEWICQGISMEFFINLNDMVAKDVNDLYMNAWKSGCKTVYYLRSQTLQKEEGCISCAN